MPLNTAAIGDAIGALVAVPALPGVTAGVRSVIDLCAGDMPHADWNALREVDYDGDIPSLKSWFDRALEQDPPAAPVRGFYCALGNPLDDRLVTTDMQLVGTREYTPDGPGVEWIFSRHYFPRERARSAALHQLYGIAHGTYDDATEVEGALGHEAEWAIGLAYAVLATRAVLEGRTVADLPTDVLNVGIAAGWGGGDLLPIGEITQQGFVPRSLKQA